jgi:hypothetical protein
VTDEQALAFYFLFWPCSGFGVQLLAAVMEPIVQSHMSLCGICDGQSGTGTGFSLRKEIVSRNML